MRARLTMKLVSVAVLLALTVVTAHECTGSAPGSATDPKTILQHGLSGLCAQQAADAAASGQPAPQTLAVPADLGSLAPLAGASLTCPTTAPTGVGG